MSHFAEVDETNTVARILVVHNDVITVDGVEDEQRGIDFLNDLFPDSGTWVQTSYNKIFRGRIAMIGGKYDTENNIFIPQQTYPSWVYDSDDNVWKAPVAEPEGNTPHYWDENTTSFVEEPIPDQPFPSWTWDAEEWRWEPPVAVPEDFDYDYEWDEDSLSWVEVE